MKIVHVCLNRHGGAAAAAWRLHQALLKRGVDSWFYTLEPRGVEDRREHWVCWKPDKSRGGRKLLQALRRRRTSLRYYQRLREMSSLMAGYDALVDSLDCEMVSLPIADKDIFEDALFADADIIHLHWVAWFIQYHHFFNSCRRNRKAVCWTLHDQQPFSGLFHYAFDLRRNPQATNLNTRVLEYKAQCMADFKRPLPAIAPSAWMSTALAESRLAPFFDSVEIPYVGASCLSFAGKSAARRTLGIGEEEILFIMLAENAGVHRKHPGWFIHAANALPAFRFVMIGAVSGAIKARDNFKATGYLNDRQMLQLWYEAADAVVVPSEEDNLPNVLLEAFACGRPVVAFATGGMQQYIIEGETGITAPVISEQGLLDAIRQFGVRHAMFDEAHIRRFAEKQFGEDEVVKQHLRLYASMIL